MYVAFPYLEINKKNNYIQSHDTENRGETFSQAYFTGRVSARGRQYVEKVIRELR